MIGRRPGPAVARRWLVALFAAFATGAVGVVGPVGAQETTRRVVVISDSIAAAAEGPMVAAFRENGWTIDFDAAVNRTVYSAPSVVESHREQLTDSVVVSLGANDGVGASSFRSRVDAVLSRLDQVPRVYWLTIPEVRDVFADANQVLREAEQDHPNLTILDWAGVAAADAARTAGDGLHLTSSGAVAMADLVVGAATQGAPTSTTAAPTTAPPTSDPSTSATVSTVPVSDGSESSAVPPGDGPTGEQGASDAGSSAWRTVLGWTVGGFALMVTLLGVAGIGLGIWALWSARAASSGDVDAGPPPRSGAHPAVRSQQRAARIAAARRDVADTAPSAEEKQKS